MYKSSVGYSLTKKGFDGEVGFKVVNGFGISWYNKTTGVILCDAIITDENEVILCL